jgi:hypothetical protein
MTRTPLIALAAAALLAATGCSSTNRIVGHNLTQTGHWYGELGITGNLNNITVQTGSRLTKLSILGDGNVVTLEDRCSLGKVELWGEANTVNIPDHLVVRIAQVGPGNQIVRHGTAPDTSALPAPSELAAESVEQPTGTDQATPNQPGADTE